MIELPSNKRKLTRVPIKEELVALTGDLVCAVLLQQLLYWVERTREFDSFLIEEQAIGVNTGETLPRYGWVYKSASDLADETMIGVTATTVRRKLLILISKGWVSERNNPALGFDRKLQYRPNLTVIRNDLAHLGFTPDRYANLETEIYYDFGTLTAHMGQEAIQEIKARVRDKRAHNM